MPTRTVANGGGNYNAIGTWVEGAVPTSADDVVFTATSGQLTMNVANQNCRSINFTNYTNTMTFTFALSCNGGPINFGTGGYTIAGTNTSGLFVQASTTITSNGTTWPYHFTFAGTSAVFTLADNMTVGATRDVIFQGTTTQTINGNTLTALGNVRTGGAATTTGTTNLVMAGTGTWSNTNTGDLRLNSFTINTAGTVTISGTVRYSSGTFTYTAGTVSPSGSLLLFATSTTINVGGTTLAGIQFQGTSQTFTLLSDINCSSFIFNGTTSTVVNGLFNINNSGSTTINQPGHAITGTASVVLTGTGNWQHNSTSTMGLNVTVNTAGTITFTGNGFRCAAGKVFLHTAGTLAGTLSIFSTGYQFNCPTIIWTSGLTTKSGTITMLADLKVGGWAVQTNNTVLAGAFTLYNSGSLSRATSGTFNATGGAVMVMNGTGAWSDLFPTSGMQVPITINTAGTITISGTVAVFNLTYVTGTVAGTYTMRFNVGCTLDTNTLVLSSVIFIAGTITLNSLLRVGVQLYPAGAITLAGSFGFTCVNFFMGSSLTLPPSIVNTITGSMICTVGTLAARSLIQCSTVAGTKAILNLSPGATQDNGYLSNTDVDSSGGVTIWTYKGVLTREVNWNQLSTDPRKQVLKYSTGTKIMHYS